jgi:D-alanyl-D-alanine dipeptidase/carboxypeptidase
MKNVIVKPKDTLYGPLMLVNLSHPIQNCKDTVALSEFGFDAFGNTVLLEGQACKMMRHLRAACGGEREILPVSGYRSRSQQHEIYENTKKNRGEDYTKQFVALPGCSEHETGLALDVGTTGAAFDFICPHLADSGASKTFKNIAQAYGFVERYPQGKSNVTGIAHEPWHFRYVGWPHSQIMASRGWVLEEYLGELALRDSLSKAMVFNCKEHSIKIYTVNVQSEEENLCLPQNLPFLISGNNAGGVVVTIWQ